MHPRRVFLATALVAGALPFLAPEPALAQQGSRSLNVKLGSCTAQLIARSPWTRNTDGTWSNPQRSAVLVPNGSSLQLPIVATGPMRVRPNALSFPMDARLLPVPRAGMFGELVANADIAGPVSAGIDLGANIKRKAGNLFLDPKTSYLYFTATHPFKINLDKKNKSQRRAPSNRTNHRRASKPKRKGKMITTGFALDPCDPAVFFGGVSVTVQGITANLDGVGFSLAGKVRHRTSMPVWTGATRRGGQPDLRPYVLDGHVYAKGGIGVGLGRFVSATGNAAVTVNLDPRRNGVWGLQEAMGLLKGRTPRTLPDLKLVIEGSPAITLPMMSIPFARVAVAIDATNPRRVGLQLAGERGPAASLADLFAGSPPPGADLIKATGKLQLFANATFDATALRPSGSYQVKVRGVLELGPLRIDGDVDVSYRVGGRPQVCAKLPGVGRACGKQLEQAVSDVGAKAVTAALDGGRFFQNLPANMDAAFTEGMKALGKALRDAEHNLHGAPKCTRESTRVGRKMGERLRARALSSAERFFDTVRPKIVHLPPDQRARAVKAAYDRFYASVAQRQRVVEGRGRDQVDNWSVNPHYGRQYADAFSRSYKASVGDLKSALGAVYRRRDNVGQAWR